MEKLTNNLLSRMILDYIEYGVCNPILSDYEVKLEEYKERRENQLEQFAIDLLKSELMSYYNNDKCPLIRKIEKTSDIAMQIITHSDTECQSLTSNPQTDEEENEWETFLENVSKSVLKELNGK